MQCPQCRSYHPPGGLCHLIYIETVGLFKGGATAKQVAESLKITAVRASNRLGQLFTTGSLDRQRPKPDASGAAQYTYTVKSDVVPARVPLPPPITRRRPPRTIAALACEIEALTEREYV